MNNYQQLIEKISQKSGLKIEEIERKIEAKRAKLSGLVSKEGAAQIIAAELGINLDKERLKISQLVDGMKRANVLGKVVTIFPIRSYNKNGREGKVANIVVADDTSNVRAVLWDTNHISLIENEKIRVGDVIELSNAAVRNGELHLSSFSDLKLSNEKFDSIVTERVFSSSTFKDAKTGQNIKTRAFIMQIFEPRYFEICPDCGKRVIEDECKVHGKVKSQKRALLNVILDDGTETMRSVLFGEQIEKLGFTNEEIFSLEKFSSVKDNLLGEEKIFSGSIRTNTLYNTIEFTVDTIENIDSETLIRDLEERV